jgi:multidrug transporter EmrE-like cation transporter
MYAVDFAASTAVVVTLGTVFLRERLTTRKVTALLLVVAGVAVLRLEAGGV